ncbi:MAG: ABC transporter permease [Chloroflexi bacterium]|nr:ABC transporter permease [Chloroflexota bacterium]
MNDLKFAFRQLLKNPGFTAVAVLTLALGIGANLAIFGILNELLLRPRPFANPDELWAITPAGPARQPVYANLCRPYYEAIRRNGGPFKGIIAYAGISPKLRTVEGAERLYAELVSGDYFSFLGVVPAPGRGFLPEEDSGAGKQNVAVIGHAFWQSQFGGTEDVIGKTLTLNNQVIEIIGVAPSGFAGLGAARPTLWMPAAMEKPLDEFTRYTLAGRLDDPKLAPAAADLISPVAAGITKELSGFNDPQWSRYGYSPDFQKVRLDPIGRGLLGVMFGRQQALGFLRFASVATVMLLLIACANVASLFLARASQRRKETATRLALGATRPRLVRQLVGEGILVSAFGTAAALLVFSWISAFVMKLAAWWRGPALDPVVDWRVFLFAAGSALAVGVVFSLFPALQATRFDLFNALKEGGGGEITGRSRGWLRHGLIVTQIVGSLMLLCGATLCLRSMSRQLAVDVGYRSDRLVIAPLNLERVGFSTNTVAPQLAEIARRIALVPGVRQVGISRSEPLDGSRSSMGLSNLDGYRSPDGNPVMINLADIGPNTFAALGIPVLHGREMDYTDLELGRKVAVVNESFVRKYWPDTEPVGKQIQNFEVIGVVKDARFGRFDEPPGPMMFRSTGKEGLLNASLIVQAAGSSRPVVRGIRSELTRIHPRLVQGEVSTLHDTMKNALMVQQTALRILGILGTLALALAVIGTYGLVAYLVTRRTREIGIRMAVGATPIDIVQLVLRTGLRLGIVSLVIGLPLSLGAAGLLRHLLTGISPFDPASFAMVGVIILLASVVACWLPARRAAQVDPMEALRCE